MSKCVVCNEIFSESEMDQIFKKGISIGGEDDFYRKPRFICKNCLKNSDEYGLCELCDGTGVYHHEDLIGGLCREHAGEISMDDEEKQGWNELSENWNKE